MKAVGIQNLHYAYPGRDSLFTGLALEIEAGQISVLLGPNGSGKSTLLALILGYLFPEAGEIEVFEKALPAYHRTELGRTAGFVSQAATLPFNYPVLEYILLGRTSRIPYWGGPSKEDIAAAERAAGAAGIEELLPRNVQELSAGELQLVSIARALAQEPRILLMDEPTSHLDPAHALDVFRLIKRLSSQGLTVLLTTHDPLHARQVADQAVLLRNGSALYAGPAVEGLSAENLGRLYGVEFHEARLGEARIPFVGLE